MPITNASRFAVHTELQSTFSGEVAETIMEMLPPFDWSHIVTKQDLVPVRTDIDIVKVDVSELKTDVNQLKIDVSELKTDVNQLKIDVSELKTDVTQLKIDVSELKTDVTQLKIDVSELRVEFGGLKKDFAQLTSDIDHRFTVFELRLESKIHKMLGDQIKWMVGTAIALNTLMLTGAIALSTIF